MSQAGLSHHSIIMTPLEKYQLDCRRDDFHYDTAQADAVQYTQSLFERLLDDVNRGFWERVKYKLRLKESVPIKGLYLWGGVGRGKTHLVDSLYDALSITHKKRFHFYRFMRMVHRELRSLKMVTNPLLTVADSIASTTRVLCLDEFHVTDIADAMLLGGLLDALFARHMVLVTTSNEAPDQLYRHGLQRARFLPAIERIKQCTDVVHLDSTVDYRLRYLDKASTYHLATDGMATVRLAESFEHIAPTGARAGVPLEVEGREIATVRLVGGAVWFAFDVICDGPRGADDYIEIARQFQTVMISELPVMDDLMNDQARRLMMLVDEFYDRNVKLIVSASAPPAGLYTGKRFAQAFRRTASRLEEMQTHSYWAKEHWP